MKLIEKEDINDMGEKAVVTCKNLIESLAGFSYIIIAIVIISLALLYLFHSRKLIYANNYQKKLIVISIGKAVSTKVDANHLRMQTYVVSAKP